MKGYFLKMSNKTATVLHPEYVEKFQCDGIKCHAKCCKKWTIAIDDKSYQKYQRIKNSAVRNKILSSMTKTPNIKGHIIKLDSQGACPLICRDSLCYIQRSLGMDYLSDTCQVYPRTLHLLDNMQLRALSMTCPVAAEMALFSPHGMDMHISDISAFAGREDNGWKSLLRTRKPAVSGTGGFAESVLLGSIAILQDASFTREARFILLGMFLDKAEELKGLPDAGVKAAVTAVAYQSGSFRREAAGMLANFTFFPKENENFMNELLSLLAKEQQLGDISGLLKQSDTTTGIIPCGTAFWSMSTGRRWTITGCRSLFITHILFIWKEAFCIIILFICSATRSGKSCCIISAGGREKFWKRMSLSCW